MFNYCERLDSLFWAEPVNAVSNIFFIIAAFFAYYLVKKSNITPALPSYILIVTLFVIGVGSFLWHTFATRWSEVLDVVPIMVFVVFYLLFFARYVLGHNYKVALLFPISFVIFSFVFTKSVDMSLFNESIGYFPPLLYLMILALLTKKRESIQKLTYIIALFLVSIIIRSIDFMVCDFCSIGTHFLWHLFNGIFLFLLIRFFVHHQNSCVNPE